MTCIQGIYRAAGLFLLILLPLSASTQVMTASAQLCKAWGEAVRIGELQPQLKEASGLAASKQFPGRLYQMNDSGDGGRFYVTDMKGVISQTVRSRSEGRDPEALSLQRCPGQTRSSCIYIGDIGDNDRRRESLEITVVDEIQNFPERAVPRTRLRIRYPDGQHDSESMAVHPDGTIFILTKETPARLFKGSIDRPNQTLTFVSTLDTGGLPTDMSISDDGQRLLVLTYADATEYTMDFKTHQKIRLSFLQQQESVAYLPGGRSFIYTTERLFGALPQFMMKVDCKSP